MLKDLIDIMRDVATYSSSDDKASLRKALGQLNSNNSTSVLNRSKQNLLVFPLLMSNSLDVSTAKTLKSAVEKEYTGLIEFIIGNEDVIDITTADSKKQFIQKLHQNNDLNATSIASMSAKYLGENVENKLYWELLNKEALMKLDEDLNANKINDLDVKVYTESLSMNNESFGLNKEIELIKQRRELFSKAKEKEYNDTVKKNKLMDANLTDKDEVATTTFYKQEYKKLNDLMPTILNLVVNYRIGDRLHTTKLMIGIKTMIHPIESSEMSYYVARSIKEESIIFRAIQFTTGEIKFFKDFVLRMGSAKEEASKTTSKWWKYLKSRGALHRIRTMFNKEGFIPNATLILNMEETEKMKAAYGVDIFKVPTAQKAVKTFFLMRLMVVDEVSEIVYYFDEDTNNWNKITLDSLKNKKDDNTTVNLNLDSNMMKK